MKIIWFKSRKDIHVCMCARARSLTHSLTHSHTHTHTHTHTHICILWRAYEPNVLPIGGKMCSKLQFFAMRICKTTVVKNDALRFLQKTSGRMQGQQNPYNEKFSNPVACRIWRTVPVFTKLPSHPSGTFTVLLITYFGFKIILSFFS